MRGSAARAIRKMINYKNTYAPLDEVQVGEKMGWILRYDAEKNTSEATQKMVPCIILISSDNNRRLYKKMKALYKQFNPEIRKDLKKE